MSKDSWLTEAQYNLWWKQQCNTLFKTTWEPINITKAEEISYFNNVNKFKEEPQYDLYFAFSRTKPLYDQRKLKENRKFPQDIRENIFQQESKKSVPVLTSLNYGKRKAYETTETIHNRSCQIATFYRRNGGVYPILEKQVSTNTHSISPE